MSGAFTSRFLDRQFGIVEGRMGEVENASNRTTNRASERRRRWRLSEVDIESDLWVKRFPITCLNDSDLELCRDAEAIPLSIDAACWHGDGAFCPDEIVAELAIPNV
jgi:hypothetical protein